jgi:hypothetical protein
MTGTVEVDGAYFGGHIWPANFARDRVARRLAKHQTGKRRVVVVLRERAGPHTGFVAERLEGPDPGHGYLLGRSSATF